MNDEQTPQSETPGSDAAKPKGRAAKPKGATLAIDLSHTPNGGKHRVYLAGTSLSEVPDLSKEQIERLERLGHLDT